MNDLIALLRSFNRKERFILLTQVAAGAEPLIVSDYFRERVNDQLPESMRIPPLVDHDYVLAMDFHLNWLAAAMQLAYRDKSEGEDLDQGSFALPGQGVEGSVAERRIFERNQEDIDLLLGWHAGGRTKLILVEAKAHSSFNTRQLASKSARFAAIFGSQGEKYANDPVDICIVLAGFKTPQQSQFMKVWDELAQRETGTHDKAPRFVALDTTPEVLIVGEHDMAGKPKTNGGHWRVRSKSFTSSA